MAIFGGLSKDDFDMSEDEFKKKLEEIERIKNGEHLKDDDEGKKTSIEKELEKELEEDGYAIVSAEELEDAFPFLKKFLSDWGKKNKGHEGLIPPFLVNKNEKLNPLQLHHDDKEYDDDDEVEVTFSKKGKDGSKIVLPKGTMERKIVNILETKSVLAYLISNAEDEFEKLKDLRKKFSNDKDGLDELQNAEVNYATSLIVIKVMLDHIASAGKNSFAIHSPGGFMSSTWECITDKDGSVSVTEKLFGFKITDITNL